MSKLSKLYRSPRSFLADAKITKVATSTALLGQVGLSMLHKKSRPAGLKRLVLSVSDLQLTRSSKFFDLRDRAERRRSTLELESFFFDLVAAFAPPLFVEAGAKEASASVRARDLLRDSEVVAFEANPYTFKRFQKKTDFGAIGVQYRNVALSSSDGTATFNVRINEDGRPSADGQGSLLEHKSYEPGHIQVEVPATTLDAVLSEFSADDCALWVDVEGAVEGLLAGGNVAFSRACAVFIEVEDKEVWSSQLLTTELTSQLYQLGLRPVARDFQSRNQHNILFVRKDLLLCDEFTTALSKYEHRLEATCDTHQKRGLKKLVPEIENMALAWLRPKLLSIEVGMNQD